MSNAANMTRIELDEFKADFGICDEDCFTEAFAQEDLNELMETGSITIKTDRGYSYIISLTFTKEPDHGTRA